MHLLVRSCCLRQTYRQLYTAAKLLHNNDESKINASMLAKVWIKQSRCDLQAMRVLQAHLDHSPRLSCTVCFHAHQTVEKALKAAVFEVAGLSDRNHRLEQKAIVIRNMRPELKPLLPLPTFRALEPLYLRSRYPDRYNPQQAPTDDINPSLARQTASIAEEVFRVIKETLFSDNNNTTSQ